VRPKIADRVQYLLDTCRGKRVLHVGCANWPYTQEQLREGSLLHAAIEKVAGALYGIDLSEEAIELLAAHGYKNLAVANIEEMPCKNPFGDVDFDLVLAGEVIEHLSNPGLFLEGVKTVLQGSSGKLVLTTVNAYCAHRFVYSLLTGREAVHPDHVSYYSRSTLTRLVERHGYEMEDFSFYSAQEYEKLLNRGRSRILRWVTDSYADSALCWGRV